MTLILGRPATCLSKRLRVARKPQRERRLDSRKASTFLGSRSKAAPHHSSLPKLAAKGEPRCSSCPQMACDAASFLERRDGRGYPPQLPYWWRPSYSASEWNRDSPLC